MGDGSAPEPVTMEIETFNKLAGDMDMTDIIRRAQPAYPPRKQARPAAVSTTEKLDCSTLEHAGKPVGLEYRIVGLTSAFWVPGWVMLRSDTRW
jgi:hypothetical protein